MGATDLSVLPQRSVVFPETVFRSSVATDVPLRVQGIVSQSGNLMEWQNDTGQVRMRVLNTGAVHFPVMDAAYDTTPTAPAGLYLGSNVSPRIGFANGTDMWQIDAHLGDLRMFKNGSVRIQSTGATTFLHDVTKHPNQGGSHTFGPDHTLNSRVAIVTTASTVGLTVKGAASQTSNLQDWHDSAGNAVAFVNNVGGGAFGTIAQGNYGTTFGTTANYASLVRVNNLEPGVAGLTVRGAASQTANLLAMQDSAGNTLASINPAGRIFDNGTQHAITMGQWVLVAPGQESAPNGVPARWNGSHFDWSGRILVINMGRGGHTSTDGHYNLYRPADATVIQGFGGASNQTVVAAGIPIPQHTALYAELGVGGNAGSVTYKLVSYTGLFAIPSNWILVASYTENSNSGRLKTGWGQHLDQWRPLSYLNGHSTYDYGGVTHYYKDGENIVHVQGLITKAANASAFHVMPVGYRPKINLIWQATTSAGLQEIRLENNGNYYFNNTNAATWASVMVSYMAAN